AKTILFTKSFLFALTYALFIHLLGFLIFQIAPFKISYQQGIFSPASVLTEIPAHPGIYTSHEHLEQEDPIPHYLIAPMPVKPKLLTAKTCALIQNNLEVKNQLEKLIGFRLLPPHSPTITFLLSGPIAETPFSFQKNAFSILSMPDPSSTLKFHYFIEAEQQSGQIFWWELLKVENEKNEKLEMLSESEKDLEKDIQKIFQSLKFTLAPSQLVLSGQLEIMITLEESHD
ncbi:MAG: hypothetical protein ACXU9U_05950, partial [Parachlamydiaceae bacterium]